MDILSNITKERKTLVNWDTVKFRASSWGNLLAEPKEKALKDRGELSKSCQMELVKIYNEVVYGRKKDITTAAMQKGLVCEEDGITLYSRVEKKLYTKNEKRLENEWFTGHPDIFSGKSILESDEVNDLKISWDADTFMIKEVEEPDRKYEAQLNVYYSLSGAKSGNIVYALVSAPQNIVEDEKRKLLYRMDVATELNPAFMEAAEELEKNMVFEDIDYRERIIKIPVPRNDELIEKMKNKVPILRQWLSDFHNKRTSRY